MEDLSRLMERTVERRGGGGYFRFHSWDFNCYMILHLFFADDTLICCGAELDQLWHLKDFVCVCVCVVSSSFRIKD